jgi:uncharacterized protein (DUF608 family)
MPRTCNCAGPCGPPDDDDADGSGVSRRGFLTLLGTGVLAAAPAEAANAQAAKEALAAWKRDLHGPSAPRRYRSGVHTDARFPLGGIGTGSFEVGADGRFTTWQLWNTLRDGHVPFFFGVRAGGTAKLLQTAGGPPGSLPTVREIEMTGEYPVAELAVRDSDLPVEVTLSAFTPFAPLDSAESSLPVACFVIRLRNPTKKAQKVSLGAFLQNTVGYDAFGPAQSHNSVGFNDVPERWGDTHPNFGGNHNAPITGDGVSGVLFAARGAVAATADRPFTVYTNLSPGGLNDHPVDHAAGFRLIRLDDLRADGVGKDAVIWIENAPNDLSAPALRSIDAAVRRGATLVWAGSDSPLLTAFARSGSGAELPAAPDIVFEDFENGYGNWKVQGEAFGTAPATGALPNQQTVSGFQGKRLVNSFLRGDDTTGKLTSKTFTVERRYIRFLVGGGRHPATHVRLIVNGKVVRRQSGRNNERLEAAVWDVAEFRGKSAHIEIVDEQTGPWGHINADQFEFGDLPISREVVSLLGDLLPARFRTDSEASHAALFAGASPLKGVTNTERDGIRFLSRTSGAGRTVLASGPLLAATEAELIGARQRAFATLAGLLGIGYTPPNGVPAAAPGWGSMALATVGGAQSAVCTGFTDWRTAWDAFVRGGGLPLSPADAAPTPLGQTVNGAVSATVTVAPGKTAEVPFFFAWHFANRFNDKNQPIGNHYATRWPDAGAVVRQVARDFSTLRRRTEQFRKTFYDSTLPYWLLDCVTSQISTLRHPGVVMRIANGDPYGWEGSNGCCPPTCTHVWGYEQTLAFLFPDLEREMRRIDFRHQQRPDGGINNRTEVPSPPGTPTGERPFSDGHASSVLKFYREARCQTDPAYLTAHWPRVRAAVDYLIARDAASSPDGKPDGTLSDDQWNTYDNAIHGVNTFIGTYYLAALRAGEEMAKRTGDSDTAVRFRSVFEKGRENHVARCWNGEYFQQDLPGYETRTGEYGPGCLSDQLIGQWWAHQLGLGYLLPPDKVKSALRAVFQHNWLTDHTNFRHQWRKFAGGSDKGLLICTWPRGGRPAHTIPYVDEVWTGIEYQVAAHMLYEGMTEEALSIVKGARDRYDGAPRAPMPRSPWNEIECGGHYARAMSSWSLLLALSGWDYDGMTRTLRLAPPPGQAALPPFRAFFSGPSGWGSLEREHGADGVLRRLSLRLTEGRFDVTELHLETADIVGVVRDAAVLRSGAKRTSLPFSVARDGSAEIVYFSGSGVHLSAGQSLVVFRRE